VTMPWDFEGEGDQVDVLTDLLQENQIKYSSVRELEIDLEDVFMQITKGIVQ